MGFEKDGLSRSNIRNAASYTARAVLSRGNGVATHDPLVLPRKAYRKLMKRGMFVSFGCEGITTSESYVQHPRVT